MVTIRLLQREEVPLVKDMAPDHWNLDLAQYMENYLHEDYFTPIVALFNDFIVGVGSSFNFGNTGWLATIITLPEYRRKGIGSRITEWLINNLKQRGSKALLLIATDEGAMVYKNFGFSTISHYRFYKKNGNLEVPQVSSIRPVEKRDFNAIIRMDKTVSGEDRECVIENYCNEGYVYNSGNGIRGFFLPKLGNGLIQAIDEEAGLKLLQLRLSKFYDYTVIPDENFGACKYLEANNAIEYGAAQKMILGESLTWNPQNIYCRIGGYFG